MTIRTAKHKSQPRTIAKGFTLTELLIAVAIFVVLMAMAVPVFRTLTGSRSIASGTNVLSATLNRVRMEAIGFQQHRGVLFYLDSNTGRVAAVTIIETDKTDTAGPANDPNVYFDMLSNAEPILLPPGVGVQVAISSTSGNRYIGFNQTGSLRVGGIIAFTPQGRLFVGNAGIIARRSLAALGPSTNAGNFFFGATTPTFDRLPWGGTQIGFCLFDSDPFLSLYGGDAAWPDDPSYGTVEADKERWLDENAVPFLMNRYNGTLIQGE